VLDRAAKSGGLETRWAQYAAQRYFGNLTAEMDALQEKINRLDDRERRAALTADLAEMRANVMHFILAEEAGNGRDMGYSMYDNMQEMSQKIFAAEIDQMRCAEAAEKTRELLRKTRGSIGTEREAEISRFEDEIEQTRGLGTEERLSALRGIADGLEALGRSRFDAALESIRETVYKPAPREDATAAALREIRDIAGQIAYLDEGESGKIIRAAEKLSAGTIYRDKIGELRHQAKTAWNGLRERVTSTAFFKDTLAELKDELAQSRAVTASREGAELLRRCGVMLAAKYIERPDFMKLYEEMALFVAPRLEEITGSILAQKAGEVLLELGYEVISGEPADDMPAALSPGEVQYLDSPYDGYQVMVKIQPDETLTARLVRTGGDDSRERDIETGKKWCADFDKFLSKMEEAGIGIGVTIRQEPEEAPLLAVTPAETKTGRKKKRRAQKDAETPRQMQADGGESRSQ
jgi:hypothetical protein